MSKEGFTDGGSLRISLSALDARVREAQRDVDELAITPRDGGGGAAAAAAAESDARVLTLRRGPLGTRHRDFKMAVEEMSESEWDDWPLNGPRTTMFVLSFIAEHFQTPENRHARFIADGRLQAHDPGVADHAVAMKLLYFGAVYDQLDLPQLAWAELACRRAQLAELKHRDKFVKPISGEKKGTIDPYEDAHLYLGLSVTRGLLCVSPELEAWVGKELSNEYMAMKERRKALEERRAQASTK